MRDLAKWLAERDDFYVFGHVAPDGDCIGSVLAIVAALRRLGKRAHACIPGDVPAYLQFLPGAAEVRPPEEAAFSMRCALAVDVSAPGMLGENRERFENCPERAVLDHHESNPRFGRLNVIDPARAATGELALELIRALDVPLTGDMADCLFAAISSDTGNFNYSNSTAETFLAAAECVKHGADVDKITRQIYRTRTFARTKLLGAALSDAELLLDGRVAIARVTAAMFADCGAVRADTERIINYLIEVEGVQIAALAVELNREVKFSLRCVAPYNVARDVAQPLGGGGHERAAGVSLPHPIDRACETVLEKIREVL